MQVLFRFVFFFVFVKTIATQNYDNEDYGINDYETAVAYDNPNQYYEDENNDYSYDQYPTNAQNIDYNEYSPDSQYYGDDSINNDYKYPSYPDYIQEEYYSKNSNNRNPEKQSLHQPLSPQNQSPGHRKPKEFRESFGKDKNDILEILKKILEAQKGVKGEHGKTKESKKSDLSDQNLNIKDLLQYLKEIANGKKPNFGEIVSKFGKSGLKEIQELLENNGFGGENGEAVGGSIAKAGFGFIQNLLKN
uniref:Uncharacterized protein n=1 Tax=Panagrolaimus superbus TaxID=310955 RepID=A0A914YJL1_9BILA